MKKFISLISAIAIVLSMTALFSSCSKDTSDKEDSEDTVTVQTSTDTKPSAETKKPSSSSGASANKAVPYVDFSKKVSAESTHLSYMDIKKFKSVAGGDYNYQWTQGGCIANGCVYTFMVTDNNTLPRKCCIVKTDIESGTVISKSAELALGHANDATYNPHDNVIVVADCGETGTNKVYVLDADTLTISKTLSLKGGLSCSIAYDETNQRYIGVDVQNSAIYVYNRSFNLVKTLKSFGMSKSEFPGEFSMQGAHTDGVYLYVLEWHGGSRWASENITVEKEVVSHIRVVNIDTGDHVKTIDLGIKREVEYIGYLDGSFYIGCNNIGWTGMEFYKVDIIAE